MASPTTPRHGRYPSPGNLRPVAFLPTAHESLWDHVADVVPGCKGRPARAKARRLAHASEIIAMRIGLRHDHGALGRYEQEILAAVQEPLESHRPLAEVLVAAVAEGNEGETAVAQLLAAESPEALRRFIREGEEALGALSHAVSAAKARLECVERAG